MSYLLHNQRFIDYAKIYTEGTVEKLKTLKAETFLKLKVIIPPLPEQQKIAEILSTQDKLIELQEKRIEQLKELKKAYGNGNIFGYNRVGKELVIDPD